MILLLKNLKPGSNYFSKVYDSNAKLPSGILHGNVNQYGDFDLCFDSESSHKKFRGQYCLANIQMTVTDELPAIKHVKETVVMQEIFKSTMSDVRSKCKELNHFRHHLYPQVTFILPRTSEIHWGVCVPSTCSPIDIEQIISEALTTAIDDSGIDIQIQIKPNQCHIKADNWLTNMDLTSIVVR